MLIVAGIVMFLVLVCLHELGHFRTAKKSGVTVHEFGFGIPPKALTIAKDKSGTEYTLNRIPLGGFVRLKGEDPSIHADFHAKDSFITASLPKRIIILLGGIIMNILTAFVIFTILFRHGVSPIRVVGENSMAATNTSLMMPTMSYLQSQGFLSGNRTPGPAVVTAVVSGTIADGVGIKSGDVITSIAQDPSTNFNLTAELAQHMGQTFDISFTHQGTLHTQSITCPSHQCLLGVMTTTPDGLIISPIQVSFGRAVVLAVHEIGAQATLTFSSLGGLWADLVSFNPKTIKQGVNSLSGPVGAVKFGQMVQQKEGRSGFLAFAAIISLALAFFNLLPIPALDGGRLLGVLIQAIFRLKPEKYFVIEGTINAVFFALLMLLGVYIIFKDLALFRGLPIPFITG